MKTPTQSTLKHMSIRDLKEGIKLGYLNRDSVKPEFRADLDRRILEMENELSARGKVS